MPLIKEIENADGTTSKVETDETDLLESGIEIVARPPGKEPRSISLLSGGEKTLTRVALDASNRAYLIWKVGFSRDKLGEMDTELFKEWFQAFAQNAGLTLHVENLYGENNHHIVESCFKGLARALRQAVEIDDRLGGEPASTKGVL